MSSSENWKNKEKGHAIERNNKGENSSSSGINGNWRTEREKNRRKETDENWRIEKNGNWRNKRDENFRSGRDENWRTRQKECWNQEGKSQPHSVEEEYSVRQIHGCWNILCEKTQEYEEVWKSAMELYNEQPCLFPVPPKKLSFKNYHDTMLIECYASTLSDKEQIKNAAEAIREKVYFPFIMHYVEPPIFPKKKHKYMHTPENEFYELVGRAWQITLKECSSEDSKKNDSTSEVLIIEKTNLIEVKSKILAINDTQSSSASYEITLPSEVIEEDYIYFPPTKEAMEKMRLTKSGKWMIYTGYNMSKQDDIWTALIPLYIEGFCVGLKASTAMITEAEQYMGGGVIHCYTANSDDVEDVKKVVDKIRSVLLYNYVLHYKTNYSSVAGRYAKEGCRSVSQYMDTVKGVFYKRDRYGRFALEGL